MTRYFLCNDFYSSWIAIVRVVNKINVELKKRLLSALLLLTKIRLVVLVGAK